MIEAIKHMPGGSGIALSTHDAIPGTPPDGITITSKVSIDPENAFIEVDLTDNPDALQCGLNVSEACTRTSTMIGIFNSIDNTVPKNAGAFRRVKLHLKDNGVVGIPRHPTSCSAATTNLADRVQNSTMRAMAEIGEGLGMGEIGCFCPPSASVVHRQASYDVVIRTQRRFGARSGNARPPAPERLTNELWGPL